MIWLYFLYWNTLVAEPKLPKFEFWIQEGRKKHWSDIPDRDLSIQETIHRAFQDRNMDFWDYRINKLQNSGVKNPVQMQISSVGQTLITLCKNVLEIDLRENLRGQVLLQFNAPSYAIKEKRIVKKRVFGVEALNTFLPLQVK